MLLLHSTHLLASSSYVNARSIAVTEPGRSYQSHNTLQNTHTVTVFIFLTNSTFFRSGDDEEPPGRARPWHQVQVDVVRQELSEQHDLPWDTLGTRGYFQGRQGNLNLLLLELPNSLRGFLAL